ncbi:MAG: AraC family transcriptional regulator [Thioalkalivibrio sp.]|nr:AraC family transcriptional regulator [Thioalkalivibrio sp.]
MFIRRFRGPRQSKRRSPHSFWEFTCVIEGEGCLTHDHGRLQMRRDTVFLVPPYSEHVESAAGEMDTIWVRVDGRRMSHVHLAAAVDVRDTRLRKMFEQLWLLAEYGAGQPVGPELDGQLAVIVARFFRLLEGHEEKSHRDLAERAVLYMTEHLAEDIRVPDMAMHFNCSEGYLHRVFKHRTGLTPIAYLTQARCHRAAHLLEHTGWPIHEIAVAVGFSDPFYFSRVFRLQQRLSPRVWRRSHKTGGTDHRET